MDTNICYTGKLKLSIANKNTIISTHYYHNKGTVNLFSFLGKCLAGNYSPDRRPQYIRAFTAGEPGTLIENLDIASILTPINSKSNAILYSIPPITAIDTSDDLTSAYNVTYKFIILSTQFTDINNINMFALYSDANKTDADISQPLAYFYIIDENDPTKLGEIEIPEGDTALIIEWTVTLDN